MIKKRLTRTARVYKDVEISRVYGLGSVRRPTIIRWRFQGYRQARLPTIASHPRKRRQRFDFRTVKGRIRHYEFISPMLEICDDPLGP